MVSRISQCDRRQLQLAIDNRLGESQAEDLSRHLQGCPHCQAELEQLAGSRESWADVKTYLSSLDSLAADVDRDDNAWPLDFLVPSDRSGMLGRLGNYEIEAIIGSGGMGVVLKAHDPALNRTVAIKVMAGYLATSAAARRRFTREAQAAAAVVHDHVMPIHAVDTSGHMPFLVMPYVAGRSLEDRLSACGVLEIKEVLRIAMQTARGLAAAHAQGLIHRDIKPANILLENGVERVRITDFGLARASDDASQTQSGFIAGTPQYMAPEQARGEPIDSRADLFSLGSVMYAMCTGRPPFRAETTFAVLRRVSEDTPRDLCEVNPDVPRWLARIVERLLAKSPADRFQTADEVAALLEQWLAHLQQPTVIPPPEQPDPQQCAEKSRSYIPWAAFAIGGMALVTTALLLTDAFRNGQPPSTDGGPQGNSQSGDGKGQAQVGTVLPASSGMPVDAMEAELAGVWRDTAKLELRAPSDSSASSLRQELWELSSQLESLEREVRSPSPSTPNPVIQNQ